jgi:IS30 family transposase
MHKLTDFDRNKNGRGYTKYHYTVKDIARITGRAEDAIRNDISRKKLNMSDLRSVAGYINRTNERVKRRVEGTNQI